MTLREDYDLMDKYVNEIQVKINDLEIRIGEKKKDLILLEKELAEQKRLRRAFTLSLTALTAERVKHRINQ